MLIVPPPLGMTPFIKGLVHLSVALFMFHVLCIKREADGESQVVLFTPGELSADGYGNYLTTNRLTGLIGEAIGAAVVMVERNIPVSWSIILELT